MFFNLDFVVECIKKICDNTQCVTCDKLISPCVRFPCGHSVCESCAERAEECLFCISANTSPVIDNPQTKRVNNTLHLLVAFQETFKINVEKFHRVSDYLKLEKKIFPECIQAPNKYINKRKSLNVLIKNKENNSPIYPGEKTVCDNVLKMKKIQYVQNWLDETEYIPEILPRKPFGDININSPLRIERKNAAKLNKRDTHLNPKKSTYRKTDHIKKKKKTFLLNKIKPLTEIKDLNNGNKNSKNVEKYEGSSWKHKCDRNESGIVLDDEPIVVEDTIIDSTIDKDKDAWLAVLEAARKDECDEKQLLSKPAMQYNEIPTDLGDSSNNQSQRSTTYANKYVQNVTNMSKNVLFYKKSLLLETCKLCDIKNQENTNSNMNDSSDVSIVINNSEFVTTIKFMHCEDNKHETLHMNSIEIQTDNFETKNFTIESTTPLKRKSRINDEGIPNKTFKPDVTIQSLDVFDTDKTCDFTKVENVICNHDNRKNIFNDSPKHSTHLIVEDSDTDSSTSCGNIHEVVAEIHTTNAPEIIHADILTALSKSQYQKRSKRTLRGKTPNSSDSSDKENLDPNRIKKHAKLGKKLKNKK